MGDSIRGDKSICLPVENEKQYRDIIFDAEAFRQYVLDKWQKHPELFPDSLEQGGFWFHDFVVSTKRVWS